MSAITTALRQTVRLDGTRGAAVVDYVSRMTLGTLGNPDGLDLDQAACGDTDVVRAKLSAMELIGYAPTRMEDILITLDTEYHLIRPLVRRTHEGLFLYVVLDRDRTDLNTVRKELRRIEELL
ncbi:hypothetical protein OOK58_09460 [Streptomyces sp. NBC_01728]|uniref:hypothetical protein n=1 Tax=unclassified Streptomyces TaxID=2593676 RepID=UPI0022554444|nr:MULTISPECIES: hypothetical protein [unclassified Streptomyces]MCX4452339.1 hypothetical protein [Streptomyces sp. NBC_01719]MCX4491699.1 hypothetical protein [Streptomyces sp. NBC_01728]